MGVRDRVRCRQPFTEQNESLWEEVIPIQYFMQLLSMAVNPEPQLFELLVR